MQSVAEMDIRSVHRTVSTGNPEIDKKLGGGIPQGSLTLIEGPSDSGKSVLAQQMVWGSLKSSYRAKVFTTENTVKSLIKQMNSLGLEVTDYYLLGRLGVRPLRYSEQTRESIQGLRSLLYAVSQASTELVFIDSLTGFVTHAPVGETIAFFEGCKRHCNNGKTVVSTLHSAACEESSIIRIRSMCDVHLHLGVEAVGDQLIKTLEVAKVRGAERATGSILSFDVEPSMGMRIIPVMKAKG